ncbi:MAG: hypothetical protein HW400_199 [Candidatus Levybacteria bacterium]|nr:hypothetical protein [Candidatus Levybacteria bacterium]
MTPESKAILGNAVRKTSELYVAYELLLASPTPISGKINDSWNCKEVELSPFSNTIVSLKDALSEVRIYRQDSTDALITATRTYFSGVNDPNARELLTEILQARVINSPSHFNGKVSDLAEAISMADELGVDNGLKGEQIRKISLDKVLESVLTGKLKLQPVAQADHKFPGILV